MEKSQREESCVTDMRAGCLCWICSVVVEASEATSCTPVSMRVWKVSCVLDVRDGHACMTDVRAEGSAEGCCRSVVSHELYTGLYEVDEGDEKDGRYAL